MGGSIVGRRPIYFNHKLIRASNEHDRSDDEPRRQTPSGAVRVSKQLSYILRADRSAREDIFSAGAATRVDGPTKNTLGFK
jgi:hypothetical protein